MRGHTTARRGKRIHVVMTNGRSFVDKLVDTRSAFFYFEREGRIAKIDVRSFAINRPPARRAVS